MGACHCNLGLSAKAIAYAGHVDHPHDPGDTHGISDKALRKRMAGRSPEWDALTRHWGELAGMLADEIANRADGCAPDTYARMRDLLDGAS